MRVTASFDNHIGKILGSAQDFPKDTPMVTETTTAKVTLHQRAMHELKQLVIISLYLYIALGSVILLKTAVLHDQGGRIHPLGHRHRQSRGIG
jgi:hypothetical protein